MKRILVLLALVLSTQLFAQEQRINHNVEIINRLTSQTASVPALSEQAQEKYTWEFTQTKVEPQSAKSFEVSFKNTNQVFWSGGFPKKVSGTFRNLTDDSIFVVFRRNQILPNPEWSTSVCFGTNCYIEEIDSLPYFKYVAFLDSVIEVASPAPFPPAPDPNHTGEFYLNINTPMLSSDSVIVHMWFKVLNSTDDDTMAITLVGKAVPVQSSVSDQDNSSSTAPQILSLYPSPLVVGKTLHAAIRSPREMGISYSIYDAFGRQTAFGVPAHKLSAGYNTLEIKELDGLAAGTYVLKVNFVGGSSDTKMFQVIN